MLDFHTTQYPDGASTTSYPDKLALAYDFGNLFPAAANSVGSIGTVTAGTLYGYVPTVTQGTGGTLAAISALYPTGGWPVLVKPTLKAVAITIVSGGTSGWTAGTSVCFLPYGIVLTLGVSGGVVNSATITSAGSFPGPGPALGTNGTNISPIGFLSSYTPGVGTLTFTVSYGLNAFGAGLTTIDDGGNYATIPTGAFVITRDSRDAAGSGAAIAAGAAAAAGSPTYYQVGPWANGDGFVYPNYSGDGICNNGCSVTLNNKAYGPTANAAGAVGAPYGYYISFAIYPVPYNGSALQSVTQGILDAVVYG